MSHLGSVVSGALQVPMLAPQVFCSVSHLTNFGDGIVFKAFGTQARGLELESSEPTSVLGSSGVFSQAHRILT